MKDIPWLGILIGVAAMCAVQLVAYLTKSRPPAHPSVEKQFEVASASRMPRAVYLLWGLCFPLSILPAIWFATSSTRTPKQVEGLMYVLMAVIWLVLGLVPYLWVARRGLNELDAYRKRVEIYSHSSFRGLVRVWAIGILVMVLVSLKNLLL